MIFPLLGSDAFESASSQATTIQTEKAEPPLAVYLNERVAEGTGREVADGFVELGSLARAAKWKVGIYPRFPLFISFNSGGYFGRWRFKRADCLERCER